MPEVVTRLSHTDLIKTVEKQGWPTPDQLMDRAADKLTVDGDADPDGWPLQIRYMPKPFWFRGKRNRLRPLLQVMILPERCDLILGAEWSRVEKRFCIARIAAFAVAILDLIVTAGQSLNELDIGEWWLEQWMSQAPGCYFPGKIISSSDAGHTAPPPPRISRMSCI